MHDRFPKRKLSKTEASRGPVSYTHLEVYKRQDLYGAQRARYISILHTLFAAGSMAAPLFAASCIAAGGWQMGYLISGGLMGLSLIHI